MLFEIFGFSRFLGGRGLLWLYLLGQSMPIRLEGRFARRHVLPRPLRLRSSCPARLKVLSRFSRSQSACDSWQAESTIFLISSLAMCKQLPALLNLMMS